LRLAPHRQNRVLQKYPLEFLSRSAYAGIIMHTIIVPAGLWLIIQAAIVAVAVIAARRYKLTGLWILAAAAFLVVFQDLMGMALSSSFRAGTENGTEFSAWLQYVPLVTMVLVLCGWCVLAFGRKQ
jgi:hypothetical protein